MIICLILQNSFNNFIVMYYRLLMSFCLLFIMFSIIACDDINETYDKKFDVYTLYKDLTIIENGNALRQEDVQLLKNYIDRKILVDSIYWLKKYSYHELFVYAANSAKNLSMGTPDECSWKINNMLAIKLVSFSPEDGELNFSMQNVSGKHIKSFRAEVRFFTLSKTKIGQIDLNFQDTLYSGKMKQFIKNDVLAYRLEKLTMKDIVVKPTIQRIVFTDTTQFVNPLGSVFEDE